MSSESSGNSNRPPKKNRVRVIAASIISITAAAALYLVLRQGDDVSKAKGQGERDIAPTIEVIDTLPAGSYVPGQLIVKLRPGYSQAFKNGRVQLSQLAGDFRKLGISKFRQKFPDKALPQNARNKMGQNLVDLSLVYELEMDTSSSVEAAIRVLNQNEAVAYAEPRYVGELFLTPNDQKILKQWYLDTVKVKASWDQEKGDSTVVIGIIDTGISFTHTDLEPKVAYNYGDTIDGVDNDNDGYVDNFKGWDFGGAGSSSNGDNDPTYVGNLPGMDHGVLVSGPAIAVPNNGECIAGVAWNCRFLPIKASLDNSLGISYGYESIIYAADHGCDIINCSWGMGFFSQFGQDAINYATINKEVLVVAAAGNTHREVKYYPACMENVIAVAGTEVGDSVWDDGNSKGTSYHPLIDICAPAKRVFTTASVDGCWGGATGTSLAAPIVCGAAAILKSARPTLTPVQLGELLRVSADDIYGINANPKYEDRLGAGRVNLFKALNNTKPSVRVSGLTIRDGENDMAQTLDTLDLYVKLINYLEPTKNLNITLSTMDTAYIEVLQDQAGVGKIQTLGFGSNVQPLRVRVKSTVDKATTVYLRIGMEDGAYQDFQYYPLDLQPAFVDMDSNRLQLTLAGTANLISPDWPQNQLGLGIKWDTITGMATEAGLSIGIAESKLVDCNRNEFAQANRDFKLLSRPYLTSNGPNGSQYARLEFSDANAGSHELGLFIRQHAYAFPDEEDQDYILIEYAIQNTSNKTLNGVYANLNYDPEVAVYNQVGAGWDPAGNMILSSHATGADSVYIGISMVSGHPVTAYTGDNLNYLHTKREKWGFMTRTPVTGKKSGDVVQWIGAGPLTIPSGDSVVVAFAICGNRKLNRLRQSALKAAENWNCGLRGADPVVDLGPDIDDCITVAPVVLNPQGESGYTYQWSNGANSPTLSVSESGTYWVRVTDLQGCSASDTIQISLKEWKGGQSIKYSPSNPVAGQVTNFSLIDPGPGLTTYRWSFGDAEGSSKLASPRYGFRQPGQYTVTLIVGDGQCTDTLTQSVTVSTITNIEEQGIATNLKIVPNPFREGFSLQLSNLYRGSLSIQIFDAAGVPKYQKQFNKSGRDFSQEINAAAWPKGTYVLRLSNNRETRTQRIVKQ